MVSGEIVKVGRQDWLLASPWPWTIFGLALCAIAWLIVAVAGEALTAVRIISLFLSLIATAIGVVIRLNSAHPSFLDQSAPRRRALALLGLTVLFALIPLAVT